MDSDFRTAGNCEPDLASSVGHVIRELALPEPDYHPPPPPPPPPPPDEPPLPPPADEEKPEDELFGGGGRLDAIVDDSDLEKSDIRFPNC